jgi:hypothetical protein
MVLIQHPELVVEAIEVGLLLGHLPPYRGGLQSLRVVDAVRRQVTVRADGFIFVAEIDELLGPVVALVMEFAGEVEKPR